MQCDNFVHSDLRAKLFTTETRVKLGARGVYSLPKHKLFDWSKLTALGDNKIIVTKNRNLFLGA